MDPPTYAAAADTTTPKRSIQDLRAQIIAHGTVLRPNYSSDVGSVDHIEVIVAKTPAFASSQQASRSTHFNEKQAMNSDGTFDFKPRTQQSSPAARGDSKHYAVLIKRSGSSSRIRVLIKGEPKDTVEEALEWMLEKTEMIMHDMVVKYGEQDSQGCVMM